MSKTGTLIPKKRPKYEEWMCDKIKEVAANGGHIPAMCSAIGVRSTTTFYKWLELHEEFKEAYEEARIISQEFYENLLLAGATGQIKGFNFHAAAMILNNKFPQDYRRSATGSNTEINIGSINSIEQLNSKELDAKIAALQEKLQLLPKEEDDE